MNTQPPISDRARRLMDESVVWDAHSCLPIKAGVDCSDLARHRASGIDYVSINVGMDFNPVGQISRVIATFRAFLLSRPAEYALVGTVDEVKDHVRRNIETFAPGRTLTVHHA